jgi:hypothetical protein
VGGEEDARFGWRKEVASRGRSIAWGCWSRRGILFWRWNGGVRMVDGTWLWEVLVWNYVYGRIGRGIVRTFLCPYYSLEYQFFESENRNSVVNTERL